MLSDLQIEKFQSKFDFLDVDKNGVVERDDFEKALQRLAQERGVQDDPDTLERLSERYYGMWRLLQSLCDANGDGQISLQEWLDYLNAALEEDRRQRAESSDYRSPFEAMARQFFELLDVRGNGLVSLEEYRAFCLAHGVDAGRVQECFGKLDVNGDGRLGRDEVIDMVLEFYFSDDPAALGNWLFGGYSKPSTN